MWSPDRLVLEGLLLAGKAFDELAWQPFRDGVDIARLHGDGSGASAAYLRYQPGASVPLHEHTGYEHIFVLSGSQRDGQGTYVAGTCVVHGPGTRHAVTSDEGCVVLAIWQAPVRIVEG